MGGDVDSGLVERARRRDQDAWADIYRLAYPRLLAFAQRRVGSAEAGREAVSETMTRALARIDSYRDKDDGLEPWLFGILRTVVVQRQRHDRRFVAIEPPERVDDPPEGAIRLVAEQDAEDVRQAFSMLNPRERELLELRVLGGLSSEQTACALGMKPSAVRMAQMRALARLRTFVEERERVH